MFSYIDNEIINNLTQSEITVLKYIDLHQEEIIEMSIQECAIKSFTSTATILRVCKKLNLSGFSELKFILKQNLSKNKNYQKSIKSDYDINNELYKKIENMAQIINLKSLNEVVKLLMSDKKIYLFASGITGVVMEYFEQYLLSANKFSTFYRNAPMAYRGISTLSKDDILFIASASGSTSAVVKVAQLAKNTGATIIGITDFNNNPLSQLSDICFYTLTEERNFFETDIKSRIGAFFIIEVIMEGYIYNLSKNFSIMEEKI